MRNTGIVRTQADQLQARCGLVATAAQSLAASAENLAPHWSRRLVRLRDHLLDSAQPEEVMRALVAMAMWADEAPAELDVTELSALIDASVYLARTGLKRATPEDVPGGTFGVESAGQRAQQGIDQVFDFWAKAIELNRDLAKKVVDANVEYLNVLQRQAEAAGEETHARFEEARQRAEKVANETQEALAKSAAELENSATSMAERASQQFEKNVNTAAEQTVKASQKVAEETDKAADQAEKATSRARSTAAKPA